MGLPGLPFDRRQFLTTAALTAPGSAGAGPRPARAA